MYSILIVDDEPLVRQGLRETIEWHKYNLHIADEAENGKIGFQKAMEIHPDIVILDIRMPYLDGLSLMEKLINQGLQSKFVILSGHADFNYAKQALNSGAYAYVLKPIENDALLATIRQAVLSIEKENEKERIITTYQKEYPNIYRQFFLDLVTGKFVGKSSILQKAFELNINIESERYCLVLFNLDARDFSDNEIEHIFANQFITITDIVNNFNDQGSRICFVLNLNKGIEMNQIAEICYRIDKQIYDTISNHTTICISRIFSDISIIEKYYSETLNCINDALLNNIRHIRIAGEDRLSQYRHEIRDAISYIEENYSSNINIKELAEILFMSPDYLMHIFKDEVGCTITEFITYYRIEIAKQLLTDSKYRVYEVAEKVGYHDVKYFGQVFKKITGVTAGAFIRQDR